MGAWGDFLLGIIAWLGSIVAPPAIAVMAWCNGLGRLPRWCVHALLAPAILVVEWALIWLLFFALHDDGSGPPGLGLLLIPSFIIIAATLAIYYSALAVSAIRTFLSRPKRRQSPVAAVDRAGAES